MGFWSTIGAIGAAVAAPFTGGTSLAWLPAAIGAGTSAIDLIGAKKASNTAKDAAAIQQQSAIDSNNLLDSGEFDSSSYIREGQKEAYENLSPYRDIGSNATTQLNQLMDPNNEFNKPFREFQAPNPQDVLNNPAIQFQLDQGQKAIERSHASTGRLNSGATLKRVNEYAQGVASQGYDDLYTRAKSEYDDAFNIYKDAKNTRLGILNTALQSGQDAANQSSNQSFLAGNQIAANKLGVAETKGYNLQGGANAQAAGKVAGSNAWSGAFNNIGQNVMDLYTLSQVNRRPSTPVQVPSSIRNMPVPEIPLQPMVR